MNKFRFTINTLAIAIFMFAFASFAQGQATRTWVSGVGDDANPCSRTAPCKTFAGAISKTARNGEINCLDPGGFGTLTITKSITIDCHEIFASVLNSGVNGFQISYDSFDQVNDIRKTVRIRNINFNGADTGTNGIRITGNAANSGNSKVFVEDCLIDGNFAGNARGISDERAGNAILNVANTTVRNMLNHGIVVNAAAGGSTIHVAISNSRVSNCAFGYAGSQGSKATIYNSVFLRNGVNIHADNPGVGSTEIAVDHCVVSNAATNGFEATSANSVIRVSNTTAMNNGTLASTAGGGQVNSYGNNQAGGTAFPGAVGQS